MSRNQRLALVAVAAVGAVAAFVIARSGGDDNSKDSGGSAAKPRAAVQRIQVRGGNPVGGIERIEAKKGERMRITVSSDRPDEVHLHGYDIEKEVTPGKPVRFSFVARIEGVFEMEVHSSNAQIAKLVVNPS